ncbi:MAG TPA: bifunctional helix-turn-helix transcriptional regulator/GNAT family N-acetyltransferase [Xanthobacteraceae bacterium]|jgi:DNA-binding MarR family transcriptional regulator/N-acetylglutamate synthase-like GNAT family acetyltransferase|nr:bifunctional helix-turn-helix transcriptional regulator/GNAT family N-acetyltransferase [Xanthobacteraceae bacterium]
MDYVAALPLSEQRIAAVRRFTRFYTRHIGVLREGLHASPFSLAQARVLYELANRVAPTAADIARDLGLDAGYLSRILGSFAQRGLIARTRSRKDGRQTHLALTPAGREAFAPLDHGSHDEVAAMLAPLSAGAQARLIEAMGTVEQLLGERARDAPPYLLRPHQPGDMGWVASRHGALYAQEYQWNMEFEALVGEIVAAFIRNFDARRERCWIAEVDGAPVGSVFLVKQSDDVAKLRLLLVEPQARGLGIGARLVSECIRFARLSGYRTLTLWTNDVLIAARRIYQAAGFRLVAEEKHHSFGHDLVGQNWELDL